MTVAAVTKAFNWNEMHIMPVWFKFYKAAATDMVDSTQLTPAFKGLMPLNGFSFSATACTNLPAMQYGSGIIDNSGTAYGATDTTLVLKTITQYIAGYPRVPPYYILAQDAGTTAFEIMEVVSDSAPATAASTVVVKRGCLGTTAMAAGVANNSYVYFLNILYLTDTTIGTCIGVALPFPGEAKTPMIKASTR